MNEEDQAPTPIWQKLQHIASRLRSTSIAELFAHDSRRVERMQLHAAGGLLLDYSKNRIDPEALDTLGALFQECGLADKLQAQLAGEPVNNTEQRPAMHTAIRACLNGQSAPEHNWIKTEYERAAAFAASLYLGQRRGASGAIISDVVNLGIGGSDLGPRMAAAALSSYADSKVRVHFVSSLDSTELADTLRTLNPETSLFLVSSKSFSTEETLCNARQAMSWFNNSRSQDELHAHFAAITGNADKAEALGISADCIFPVPDWVGGRYSLWSSSGLALMVAIGQERFEQFLHGAWLMDQNARNSDFNNNMAAILAALEIWHCNILNYGSLAVIPYSYQLRLLPSYLQQLVMESNGKSVNRQGAPAAHSTSPVLWGTAGTEGQHSFHQLLHQGTEIIPVDFILCLGLTGATTESETRLASHCLAQSKALMEGKSEQRAKQELLKQGMPEADATRLAPHRAMPGNRPSSTIVLEQLSPQNLGALIALYEHKTFFTSVIWDINPFDQWGVELGKQLSQEIFPALAGNSTEIFDPSTNALIQLFRSRHPQ